MAIVVYIIIVLFDLYAVQVKDKSLEFIVKPLLMPTLALFYVFSVKKVNFWALSAIFFSFWGDVMLLFDEKYFVFGLGSFLVAHILYIKLVSTFINKRLSLGVYLKAILPFVLFFVGILLLIYENLNEMLVPVLFYGIAIAGFGMMALVNYQEERTNVNLLLLLGAIIFIISDSFIALNLFHSPKHFYNIMIMLLYALSQFLICIATIAKQTEKI